MTLLQTEAAGFFDAMMQQGIAFGLMALIIFVLARRIVKLEKKIEDTAEDRLQEAKENIVIIKDATEAMQKVAKKLNTDD